MKLHEIMEMDSQYYMNTFGKRTPVSFEYGKGIRLYDTEGREYMDLIAGIAVNALGHGRPALVEAIGSQAARLIHCSNLYYIENQAKLAKMIAENSCADRVFFANSGAEANEGAIKLAKIYFKKKGMPEKFSIITLKNSFHGRTLATVAATGQKKYQDAYTPLIPGFKHVAINDIDELKANIGTETCAIMLELVQGESGVHPADTAYVKEIRKICNENGILLIFDEIQTGLGRTGKLFAYQNYGVEPDIFTLAKALGGGFPIGAVCAKEEVASAFYPGDHGSTFGGNPLACAAGLAVLKEILENDLPGNAKKIGKYLMENLKRLAGKHRIISDVRGIGLMIGIQLREGKAPELKNELFARGILVGSVGLDIIRLLPPLIITKEDIDEFVTVFDEALTHF
ncbi:MAG: aspartate aminotransferase family protein [Bacillota bacterium]